MTESTPGPTPSDPHPRPLTQLHQGCPGVIAAAGLVELMLSIGKLRIEDGVDYYLRTVADGTEEYYTADREARGRWIGASRQLLGLDGEVFGDDLRAVLGGPTPRPV